MRFLGAHIVDFAYISIASKFVMPRKMREPYSREREVGESGGCGRSEAELECRKIKGIFLIAFKKFFVFKIFHLIFLAFEVPKLRYDSNIRILSLSVGINVLKKCDMMCCGSIFHLIYAVVFDRLNAPIRISFLCFPQPYPLPTSKFPHLILDKKLTGNSMRKLYNKK